MQGLWKDKYKHFIKDKKSVLKKPTKNFTINGEEKNAYTRKSNYRDYELIKTPETVKVFLVALKRKIGLSKKFINKKCISCQFDYLNINSTEKKPYYNSETEKIDYYGYGNDCHLPYHTIYGKKVSFNEDKKCKKHVTLEYKYERFQEKLFVIKGKYYYSTNDTLYLLKEEYEIENIVKELKEEVVFHTEEEYNESKSYYTRNRKIFLYGKRISRKNLSMLRPFKDRFYECSEELKSDRRKMKVFLKQSILKINPYENKSFKYTKEKVWIY